MKKVYSLRLPEPLMKKLGTLAKKENRSRTNFIESTLQDRVKKRKLI